MHQHTFAVISPIREDSVLFDMMADAATILEGRGIPFQVPKMGRHVTLIPPFKATHEEMEWLAMGLEMGKLFFSRRNLNFYVVGKRVDILSGKALVFRLESAKHVRDLVENWRSFIPRKTEWVYPPESYLVNFHATIGEGAELEKDILSKGGLPLFGRVDIFQRHFPLEPPHVYKKVEGGWHPFKCR